MASDDSYRMLLLLWGIARPSLQHESQWYRYISVYQLQCSSMPYLSILVC